jgi:chromatin assembly factor 1 subunit A
VSVAVPEKAKPGPEQTGNEFIVPSLPSHLAAPNSSIMHDPSSNTKASTMSKPLPVAPKTQFPDNLLPILLSKIESLSTGNFGFIVESIHQDLKAEKVKKNAIEAKVREVGEKSKDKKVWVVKDMYKVSPIYVFLLHDFGHKTLFKYLGTCCPIIEGN